MDGEMMKLWVISILLAILLGFLIGVPIGFSMGKDFYIFTLDNIEEDTSKKESEDLFPRKELEEKAIEELDVDSFI